MDAGTLVRNALQGCGSGGGHKAMAGGYIPMDEIHLLGKEAGYQIESRFMKQVKLLDGAGENDKGTDRR